MSQMYAEENCGEKHDDINKVHNTDKSGKNYATNSLWIANIENI